LTDAEKDVLYAIEKPADVKTCVVTSTWVDDNMICIGTRINNVPIGFWWIDDADSEMDDDEQDASDIIRQFKRRRFVHSQLEVAIEAHDSDGKKTWLTKRTAARQQAASGKANQNNPGIDVELEEKKKATPKKKETPAERERKDDDEGYWPRDAKGNVINTDD
jgi:hypothetical protein